MNNLLMTQTGLPLLVLGLGFCVLPDASAQHVNAGATSTTQNSPLYFANAQGFVNASGFVVTNVNPIMYYSNSGIWGGLINRSSPTFTALAQTTDNGATPSPVAAAPGAFVQLRFETVPTGPEGGVFSFWEAGSLTPTYSLTVGQSVLDGNLIPLSDASHGAGLPGADPFGHLHGRRFAATLPGVYTVGFRLVDTSLNGLEGGAIHSPSDLYLFTFTAIPEPTALGLAVLGGAGLALWRWRTQKIRA